MSDHIGYQARTATPSPAPRARTAVLPAVLPLLPLTDRPFFPGQAMPLVLDRAAWPADLSVDEGTSWVGLVLAARGDTSLARNDFRSIGTACRILQVIANEDKLQVYVEGVTSFRIVDWVSERPFVARVEHRAESDGDTPRVRGCMAAVIAAIKELLPLNAMYAEELKLFLRDSSFDDPARLANFAATLGGARNHELQQLLEIDDVEARLQNALLLLKRETEKARNGARARNEIDQRIDEDQRRFWLREQLKEIQRELGIVKDDREAERERLLGRVRELPVPETGRRRIDEELQKLSILEAGSPEYAVTRNYLDWVTQMPWGVYSRDNVDLDHARKVLDADHDGLEDVKDRIVEFLAVGAMKGQAGGSILLLVGPPGVGKTSVGRSIAHALGRKFHRFSVGGMRDEADIKGQRRSCPGAMPGKFIQAIKEVGVSNPVIMLDEIDKVGSSYQGNPAFALLEALDPEQNVEFRDRYLETCFDLSKVLFVCTANQLDTIPRALIDRMEVIRLAGYITSEKLAIAQRHLLPRQMEKAGLKAGQLRIERAAIREIIEGYAREAGVRGLEKKLGTIARKSVVAILRGKRPPIRVTAKNLEEYLEKPVFQPVKPLRGIGVATGLAWTAMGGTTLDVEATRVHASNRGFRLTGQLGDVMRESAEIAYSYIFAHCGEFAPRADFFDKSFLHLHVPGGAIPKDGPSAGVTMATALLSLARGQRTKAALAMTGEITLTGHVLPVGGIREKVVAARRVKIAELILPDANKSDFDELAEHVRAGLTVHYVRHYREIVPLVFPK